MHNFQHMEKERNIVKRVALNFLYQGNVDVISHSLFPDFPNKRFFQTMLSFTIALIFKMRWTI